MIPSALSAQLQQGLTDFLRYSFWSSTPGMERVIDDLMADPQVRFLYPAVSKPEGDPAWDKYPVVRVDSGKLVRLDGDEEPEPGSEAVELLEGHRDRVVRVGQDDLRLFSRLFDNDLWK